MLASLRSFVRGTVAQLAAYRLPVPPGADPTSPADAGALSQQSVPPMLYPSIGTAWRRS